MSLPFPTIFLQIQPAVRNIYNKLTNWEAWPFKLIYAPLIPVWIYYTFRSRAIWFFTSSNPKLTFGGMDGEPKKEMYDLLPPDFYPTTFNAYPKQDFADVLSMLDKKKITFPLIVKPEIGGQGILFRKIEDAGELELYHSKVPVEYIVQQMVSYTMEVSVFYIRYPDEQKGKITGFLHKIPMHVTGNGEETLGMLISRHPKANRHLSGLRIRHDQQWNDILANGERYMLSYAANHNRGAQFIDLRSEIDERLVAIFDKISLSIDDFFYGRYDIMCNSIEDLKEGKNFSILEYNGCGAEPNHFYDTGYSLTSAYREILMHWKCLFEISEHNRMNGVKPWSYRKGRRFMAKTNRHFRIMREADRKIA